MKYIIDVPEDRVVNKKLSLLAEVESPLSTRIQTGIICEPYTEPDRNAIENEVWQFAKDIRLESFIEDGHLYGYISKFDTYQEAKAKFEAWKKQKDEIRVGDEVCYVDDHQKKIVVTSTYSDGFDSIDSDGNLYLNRNPDMWKKTGRRFDEVEELLEKMRGETT